MDSELVDGMYYVPSLDGDIEPLREHWAGDKFDIRNLKNYCVFRTKEDAMKATKIIIKALEKAYLRREIDLVDPDDFVGDRAWKAL